MKINIFTLKHKTLIIIKLLCTSYRNYTKPKKIIYSKKNRWLIKYTLKKSKINFVWKITLSTIIR